MKVRIKSGENHPLDTEIMRVHEDGTESPLEACRVEHVIDSNEKTTTTIYFEMIGIEIEAGDCEAVVITKCPWCEGKFTYSRESIKMLARNLEDIP